MIKLFAFYHLNFLMIYIEFCSKVFAQEVVILFIQTRAEVCKTRLFQPSLGITYTNLFSFLWFYYSVADCLKIKYYFKTKHLLRKTLHLFNYTDMMKSLKSCIYYNRGWQFFLNILKNTLIGNMSLSLSGLLICYRCFHPC